ncbi:unnamed protein product [Scytosiphon promiscuus]
MRVEEGALALLAVVSCAGAGGAGVLASAAAGTAVAASSGNKDAPRWSLSLDGRLLGGEIGGSRDAALPRHRRHCGRLSRRRNNQRGASATEAERRRRSAVGVRGGAVVSDPYSARMQVMITRNMRKVLVEELGYLAEEVDDMDPKIAAVVIEKSLPRPRAGMPIAWRKSIRQRKTGGPLFLRPVRLLAVAVETAAGAAVNGAVAVALFPFFALGKGFGAVRTGGAKGVAATVLGMGVAAVLAVLVTSARSGDGGADGAFLGSAGLQSLGDTLAAAKARLPALKGKGSSAVGDRKAFPDAERGREGGGDGSANGGGATAAAKWAGSARRRRKGQPRRSMDVDKERREGEEDGQGGSDGDSGLKKDGRARSSTDSSSSEESARASGRSRRDSGGRRGRRATGTTRAGESEEGLADGMGSNPRATEEHGAATINDLPPNPLASRKTSMVDEDEGMKGEESWEELDSSHRWGRTPMDEHIPSEEEMEGWEDTIQETDSWLDQRINKVAGLLFGRDGWGKDDRAPPK